MGRRRGKRGRVRAVEKDGTDVRTAEIRELGLELNDEKIILKIT